MKAALHPLEQERLAALTRYQILDTPREKEFDDIADLVAAICDTPIAVVNFIADGRQWFKSEIGIGVREMPLEPSICAHALLQSELMIVPDTLDDDRFIDNPLVLGEPGLRFYAGALLNSDDGYPLGTLCVLDVKPRELAPHQVRSLQTLARHVMHLLEMRKAKQREAGLREGLEQTLAAHKRMVDTVSHDLRNPINTIVLSAELLRQYDDPELKGLADRLCRMSRQMTTLIDDLHDYDALRCGQVTLQIAPVDPQTVLDEIEDAFSLTAKERGVELQLERSAANGMVLADSRRCTQMLANLVQNAIKFTPSGGQVVVRTRELDDQLQFEVEDTGVGIRSDDLPHLFDAHWRADDAANHPGSGLGLSIVQMLASAHDSHVDVESKEGCGSSFRFGLAKASPASSTATGA